MQKSDAFVEKYLNIDMIKIKNIVKLEITAIMQVNIEVLHITSVF